VFTKQDKYDVALLIKQAAFDKNNIANNYKDLDLNNVSVKAVVFSTDLEIHPEEVIFDDLAVKESNPWFLYLSANLFASYKINSCIECIENVRKAEPIIVIDVKLAEVQFNVVKF
jgi:hypothetical protein